jgi:hypothetical protein
MKTRLAKKLVQLHWFDWMLWRGVEQEETIIKIPKKWYNKRVLKIVKQRFEWLYNIEK